MGELCNILGVYENASERVSQNELCRSENFMKIRFPQAVKQQSKRGRKKINLVLFRYIKLKEQKTYTSSSTLFDFNPTCEWKFNACAFLNSLVGTFSSHILYFYYNLFSLANCKFYIFLSLFFVVNATLKLLCV